MSGVTLLVVSLACTSAMLSIIFFSAWKSFDRMSHTLTWAVAFLVATVQWVTNLSQSLFPSYELYWVFVNGLSLTVVTLAWLGHRQRVGLETKLYWIWVLPLPVLFAVAWFTYVSPHVGIRMALIPFYGGVMLMIVSSLILRFRKELSSAEWGTAIIAGVFAVLQICAGIAALMQGPQLDPTYLTLYQRINFLAMPTAYIGMGMFTIFMVASDLSEHMTLVAMQDQLTGLLNRRGFGESASKAYAWSRRTARPVSVILTDIDRFKQINDEHGHFMGDQAIVHFAKVLSEDRRAEDILARIGGEEFALVLPGTNVTHAVDVAKELCTRLRKNPMETDGKTVQMTASFGVASISEKDTCLSDVVARADVALYQSKNKGRNRVDLLASQVMLAKDGSLVPVSS
ncbi:MAG: diguanylate cyclase [Pseudomonadota bacterium]